ncbi:hypothetical protein KY316_00255 [Candidatus Woesearchaeota archaeon]|nr:hypothetical protein [Candidatus Woesearchaeota archaeon]
MAKRKTKKKSEPIPIEKQIWYFEQLEQMAWAFPAQLEGKIYASLEQFNAAYRIIEFKPFRYEAFLRMHEPHSSLPGFDRYSVRDRGMDWRTRDIAYGCPECKQVVVGPPTIDSVLHSKKVRMTCRHCHATLYEKEFGEEEKAKPEQPQETASGK